MRGIYLYDAHTFVEKKYVPTDDSVNCVAFSPDGTILASTFSSGSVRLWQVSTGELLDTSPVTLSRNFMTSLRGLLAVVIVFLTANASTLPDCALADVQYFPIPAVSSSKNDGNDTGLIVPVLITDPDGELKYIVAPMIVQNSIVGTRGTINLFRYEPGGREIRFIGSYTERIERKVVFSYTDPAFSQGRYSLNFGASFFKNATARFYGLGQVTSESKKRITRRVKDGRTGVSGSTRMKSLRLPLASDFVK